MHEFLPYVLCVMLLSVGLYAVAVKKNLIKIIIGVLIIHNAINMFLVLLGYRDSGMPDSEDNANPLAFCNQPTDEVLERIVRIVRSVRPDVMLTLGFLQLKATS